MVKARKRGPRVIWAVQACAEVWWSCECGRKTGRGGLFDGLNDSKCPACGTPLIRQHERRFTHRMEVTPHMAKKWTRRAAPAGWRRHE